MIYTGIILILMTFLLIKDIYKPAIILFSSLILLYIGDIVSLNEVFIGFSNHGMLTVGMLFIVAYALQSSSGFERTVISILGKGKCKLKYFRLMFPVAFMSAFLNNTPIVASLIPVVKNWTKKNNLNASKFLIPLSYAAILGGLCTLIGTSTNLVVHGLLLSHGFKGFSFFEISKVGIPVGIIIILYFSLGGHKLLPDRKDIMTKFKEHAREFVVEMEVGKNYPHIGKSVENANLRHLKGLYLFQIIRGEKTIAPISPKEKIEVGDRLFFTGLPDTIYELQKTPGLNVLEDHEYDLKNIDSDKLKTYEVVISNSSPLVGQTVRDSDFRTKYGSVILGIHRSGKRIDKKVGDIEFQPNDTLFILAKKGFADRWYHSKDFSLVSQSLDRYDKPEVKGKIALILIILMILSVVTGIIPSMLAAASISAVLMVLFGVVSFNDAKKSIDFDVLIVIASAFGIGTAIEKSGLADFIAGGLLDFLSVFGRIGIVAGVFFITSLYTELITNNAAAAIMFPIALSTAQQVGADPRPFFITIAVAASASFATPIGYQTNMMVYNPGSYKFIDFLKTGVVINILVGIITTLTVYLLFF